MEFQKMHSLGNDFVIVDLTTQECNIDEKKVIHMCHRKFGIGCDQMLTIKKKNDVGEMTIEIFNQDGSRAAMCGNGLRCISGLYFKENKINNRLKVTIDPIGYEVVCTREKNDMCSIDVGIPLFHAHNVIQMGNNHKINYFTLDDSISSSLEIIEYLRSQSDPTPHPDFNVSFVALKNNKLHVVTIERGVGETMACGSASCASAVYCIQNGMLASDKAIEIVNEGILKSKNEYLEINWSGKLNSKVKMTGTYKFVFNGKIIL